MPVRDQVVRPSAHWWRADARRVMTRMEMICIAGGRVEGDGVCAEHGETACVVQVGMATSSSG